MLDTILEVTHGGQWEALVGFGATWERMGKRKRRVQPRDAAEVALDLQEVGSEDMILSPEIRTYYSGTSSVPGVHRYLVKEGGAEVGFLALETNDCKYCDILEIFVPADLRGRGIANRSRATCKEPRLREDSPKTEKPSA